MQKFVSAYYAEHFEERISQLLNDGWRIVPTTLIICREGQKQWYCCILEKESEGSY